MGLEERKWLVLQMKWYAYCSLSIGAIQAACKVYGIPSLACLSLMAPCTISSAKIQPLAEAVSPRVRDGGRANPLGLAGSCLKKQPVKQKSPFAGEAFADRAYQSDGTLVPRKQPGAGIHDVELAASRVVRMVKHGEVEAIDGTFSPLKPQSICLHGDTPSAVAMAAAIREILVQEDISIQNIKEVLGI